MVTAVRVMQPVVRRLACRAIAGRNRSRTDPTAGRFTRSQVNRIVNHSFARFDRRVPDVPSEPTLGSRQNVLLAALTLSFLETLEADEIERAYAIELTSDVCWRFYRQWGQGTRAATRLITRDPVRRLRLSVNAFLTFPFGRPGYQFDDVPQPDGRSLDMQRCPVADYLASRGAADLCAGSWCNLDYALAEMWGGTLERSTTLVTGGSCCDFRFRAPDNPDAPLDTTVGRPLPMVAA
jgi:L-2-amino-thiazoline-4-carboxylic acid hydrolase